VTVGCVAAYLFSNHEESAPENLTLEAFIRAQEQVAAQVGTVLGMTQVKQVVAYPGVQLAGLQAGDVRGGRRAGPVDGDAQASGR